MKRKLSIAIALATLAPAVAFSEVNWYGKASVTLENANMGDDSVIRLLSNASRVGLKGSEELSDGLSAIYKMEYEVTVDDGTTFSQRNIYLGVKGGFGQVIAGNFDTPTKSAQGKVDQFNDLSGDLKKVISKNDNREANSVMYSAPSSAPVGFNLAYIASEEDGVDAGISTSVTFSNDTLYAAVAYDQDVEEIDSTNVRAVFVGTFGPAQIGAMYESFDADSAGEAKDGMLVSAAFKVSDKATLKAQFGTSDQVKEGGETISVGADFKYTKNVKSFVYYTMNSADNDAIDDDYLGVGMEMKF